MVIAKLTGGLGNQLFQYAAAKSLATYHGVELLLEVSSFYRSELPDLEVPRNFELYNFTGVTEPIVYQEKFSPELRGLFFKNGLTQKMLPRHRRRIYKEPFYHFDKNFFKAPKNVFLQGGWQSEKYFSSIKQNIYDSLQLKQDIIKPVADFAKELREKESVAVHIRRGDYLRKQIILEWHGVMNADYYTKAFDTLKGRIGSYEVFYFSDDPEWVKKELVPIMPGTIVSKETSKTHFDDFYLMSQCKHNILANSSFSWWTAWLNPNPSKVVIAPVKWFDKAPCDTSDLIPVNWIRV